QSDFKVAKADGEQHETHPAKYQRFFPDGGKAEPFQHHLFDDDEIPSRGYEVGQHLEKDRHILYREQKTREQHRWQHHPHQGSHHRRLLRFGADGQQQPDRKAGEDEQHAAKYQQPHAALYRQIEKDRAQHQDNDQVDHRYDEVRHQLGYDDGHRFERRDEQDLHRPQFLFAHDRDRGHHRADQHQHQRHDARHEIGRAPQFGVVHHLHLGDDLQRL